MRQSFSLNLRLEGAEMNMKKLFLLNLPYLLFVYPFDKLAQAFRLAPGSDLSGKLLSIGDGFTAALSSPWLSFQPTDLLIGIAGAVVLRMAVYLKGKNAKKYRLTIGSPQHSLFGRGASCKYAGRINNMKTPERALSSKTMGSSLLKKDCCLSFC